MRPGPRTRGAPSGSRALPSARSRPDRPARARTGRWPAASPAPPRSDRPNRQAPAPCADSLAAPCAAPARLRARRSEEHTSELQSPCNLVCRLLLEKKKKELDLILTRLRRLEIDIIGASVVDVSI